MGHITYVATVTPKLLWQIYERESNSPALPTVGFRPKRRWRMNRQQWEPYSQWVGLSPSRSTGLKVYMIEDRETAEYLGEQLTGLTLKHKQRIKEAARVGDEDAMAVAREEFQAMLRLFLV